MNPARPWSTVDRNLVASALAISGVLWAWGWWASSGTADLDEAVFGVVLAVAAVGAAARGALSWVAAGRRAGRARHHELTSRIDERFAAVPTPSTVEDALVELPGSSRVHRPDCLLVRGKDVRALPRTATRLSRRIPCEMCRP